jgi:two-component system, cell cycle sensor histidine kinase and response regulator CckA
MKLLHLEDNTRDAALVRDLLEAEWPEVAITLVSTRQDFETALEADHAAIISDYNLPGFSGRAALQLARQRRPEIPFIFLSGTIGEEAAVEMVRDGASDYVLKDRMQRLPLAIQRAVRDAQHRQERRHAAERICEQAELLDKARDGIVVNDPAGVIIYWNEGAERIFGWSAKEMMGQSVRVLFGGSDVAFAVMEEHLAHSDQWEGDLALAKKAGEPLLAEVRITVIRRVTGEMKSRLSIITDVTERKRLEDQFLRAQRMESLGMLAAGIAHDLNNALAPMLMVGEMLKARMSDAGDRQLLRIVEQSAERGAALVRQIVSFAAGRNRETVLIQTKHLLNDVGQLIGETFPKSIQFIPEIPHGLWTVRGDPTQLHQVLVNLCINARDAMPHGGVLRLRARNELISDARARELPGGSAGQFLVIEVADSGTGIPPDVLARIWEPFFTTKAEGKGTGLGLSTVRGIAARHGGFVTVASEVGRGTTFRVYLPALAEHAGSASGVHSVHPFGPHGEGEAIFIVDDQPAIRDAVSALLTQNGYKPATMADATEALAQYVGRIGEVALIITDFDMPRMDGVTFARALFSINPTIKVLVMSGGGSVGDIEQAAQAIGAAFIAKPFTPESLLSKVHQLLSA